MCRTKPEDEAPVIEMFNFPSLGSNLGIFTPQSQGPVQGAAGFNPDPVESTKKSSGASTLEKFTWLSPVPLDPNVVIQTLCSPVYKAKVDVLPVGLLLGYDTPPPIRKHVVTLVCVVS